MKKLKMLGLYAFGFLASFSAYGQDMPAGVLVQTISCSLNDGVSMGEVVRWARANPRDGSPPDAVFFRQAIYAGNFRENYDFRIASYYPSYGELNARQEANRSRPDVRARSGTRGSDLFTCNPATQSLAINRTIPGGDGFSGEETMMTTRFCRLNEGATVADAYRFAQGVANNYRSEGDTALMQVYTRALGPVQEQPPRGVVITSVPATSAAWAARMDLGREGFNATAGLTLPMACDAPALWRTYSVYRSGN